MPAVNTNHAPSGWTNGLAISSVPSVGETSITAVPLQTCNRRIKRYNKKNTNFYIITIFTSAQLKCRSPFIRNKMAWTSIKTKNSFHVRWILNQKGGHPYPSEVVAKKIKNVEVSKVVDHKI